MKFLNKHLTDEMKRKIMNGFLKKRRKLKIESNCNQSKHGNRMRNAWKMGLISLWKSIKNKRTIGKKKDFFGYFEWGFGFLGESEIKYWKRNDEIGNPIRKIKIIHRNWFLIRMQFLEQPTNKFEKKRKKALFKKKIFFLFSFAKVKKTFFFKK